MANVDGANGQSKTPVASLEEFLDQSYDFVICGGGTAGLTIAARLTENPDVTVGVIEAGKCQLGDPLVDTPAAFTQMFSNPDYEWGFRTTPQKANNDSVHHMVRGKLLGGSSGINYMMYVRGSDADYDDWAALVSDPGWASASMKKYMRKHQTLEPASPAVIDRSTMPFVGENHGTSGPVRTSFNPWRTPIEDAAIAALDEAAGFTHKPLDPWGGDHIGFYNTLGTVARTGPNKGKRSYAARGYFEPNKDRPNLKVLCEAVVSNVVLEGNTATGVVFTHKGAKHEVKAKREVLVCGGTIQSPQILELSGIGNPEILRAAGVECKVPLASVGENFQDHVTSIVAYSLKPGIQTTDAMFDPAFMAEAQRLLMEEQSGPLTGISSCQGFFPYSLIATPEELKATVESIRKTPTKSEFERKQLEQVIKHLESDKSANIQMVLLPATANFETGVQDQSRLFPGPTQPGGPGQMSFAMLLSYPASRGSIHITSSDPSVQPAINPAYIEHPADKAVLAASLRFAEKAAKSPLIASQLTARVMPPAHVDLSDPQQADKAVQDWVMGTYHPIGSVSMGEVLDSRLRVKGVRGLRVADASVFPNHVSGNIVSSVYAVAERAADLIKEDYGFAADGKAV